MNTWFKTTNNGTKRYIVSNQITGSNAILDFYVDTDNTAKLAVKNSANNLLVLNSGVAISSNTWYFGGFSWSYNPQGNLILKLYINGNESTATYSNTLDFSGVTTTLGGNISGNNKLNGNLEQFIYSNICLADADMQGIYNLGRGNYLSANGANNQYTYQNDQLNTVSANGVTYHFSYDRFGNSAGVAVGSQNIITNNYNNAQGSYTGNLTGSTYSNGNTVALDYDDLNRVIRTTYNGQNSFEYQYNDMGALGNLKDHVNNVNYKYMYDFAGRLVQVEDGSDNGAGSNFTYTNTTGFTYDKNNNVLTLNETVKNNAGTDSPYTTTYVYNDDNTVGSVTTSGSGNNGTKVTIYETLDTKLGRISSTKLNNNFTTTYTYVPGIAANATSNMIASISNGSSTISYNYDRNGNIETITEGTNTIKYTYNELNELVREDNQVLNKTVVYSYDKGGNILSKVQYPYTTGTLGTPTATINYVYGDNNWKDKLTSYNGQSITYDAIGNPLTYNGKTYTWERGNELAGISGGGLTAGYKYNSAGIRTVKTINGVTTKYHLVGDKVTYESNGSDTVYYSYDPNGNLLSMNLNGTEYFYVRNAQGDIIKIVNASGTVVVSYVYDTWGKSISTTGTLASTVGAKNPYRYRGYRYDSETGLYYLQSRYYNPEWGRFLNADSLIGKPGVLLAHNVFAYCGNNPVNCVDPTGNKSYVIYYSHPESDRNFDLQALNSIYYDANSSDVCMLKVGLKQEFFDAWKSIGDDAQDIYIMVHGTPGLLWLKDGSIGYGGDRSFDELKEKKVRGMVYLLACEGGAGDEGSCTAAKFAKLTGTFVLSCTGGVSYAYIPGCGYCPYASLRPGKWGFWRSYYYSGGQLGYIGGP